MLSLTFVGAWFSSFKIPPKFIDSVLIYLFRRMYRDIFWANCKLQIIASPCICNRVACPRGMETAYLNHCLHYSYVVLVSWSHSLLMEAKRNVFCLLVIKFYFRFVQRCLFFFISCFTEVQTDSVRDTKCSLVLHLGMSSSYAQSKYKIKLGDPPQDEMDYLGFLCPSQ